MDALSLRPLAARPAALLCDMDGLLLDSERALLDCWRIVARAQGHAIDDALWLSMIGLHEAACAVLLRERVGEAAAASLAAALEAEYGARVAAGIALRPGATELLDTADALGLPLALVTSTRRASAQRKLTGAGVLARFAATVFGDEVGQRKPAPEPYLRAAALLGVDPAHCLVLEDSVPGVHAGLAAGAVVVQVPDLVHPTDDVRALGHRIAGSLHDVVALLRR